MTLHEQTISKIRQLPENLLKQVNDFVDFIVMDEDDDDTWSLWEQFCSVSGPSGLKFSDYCINDEEMDEYLALTISQEAE
ncbi:hypothetical protein [Gloeothece verrucosa]|uniref:DUF2281 domain-containing protein n=1 Tax=Gloeothece verrucosa (strain PCC 7822) TaxID=497965 RepID=E0U905_GLOV7|nr:hypothetical protein [Gloeothece verrucosa]ADN16144.1 conserved hypothetical protein [Gloeothece verrucosa PCC 7822]